MRRVSTNGRSCHLVLFTVRTSVCICVFVCALVKSRCYERPCQSWVRIRDLFCVCVCVCVCVFVCVWGWETVFLTHRATDLRRVSRLFKWHFFVEIISLTVVTFQKVNERCSLKLARGEDHLDWKKSFLRRELLGFFILILKSVDGTLFLAHYLFRLSKKRAWQLRFLFLVWRASVAQ